MVALSVTFDLGRYHATPWGAHVNEARVEWPPSPWRIMRALLATGYAHADVVPVRSTVEAALAALAKGPPPRYRLPAIESAHTRHYLPLASWSPTKAGETSLVVDAFHTVRHDDPLRVVWDVNLESRQRSALEAAARAVGSLGRSEAVCTMRVDDLALTPDDAHAVPLGVRLPVPAWAGQGEVHEVWSVAPDADAITVLRTSVTALRKRRQLVPAGTVRVPYLIRRTAPPVAAPLPQRSRPTLAHLRLVSPGRPALTEAAIVATVCRAALQRRFDTVAPGRRSHVFSGHDADGRKLTDQHQHAHYLVGSDPGVPRTDHVWVWAPSGFSTDEQRALGALRTLHLRDAPEPLRVVLAALGDHRCLELPRLLGPAAEWRSVTPFLLPRHPKRRGGVTVDGPEDQLRRELAHRALPDPESVMLIPGRWMDFQRTRPGGSRSDAATAVGAHLSFAEPLRGPLALGGLSHFGLGRFEPLP